MFLTYSNLYPRPDHPARGMFNVHLFRALAGLLPPGALINLCPVAEWRLWRWPAIRCWRAPDGDVFPTVYLPVAHLPVVGRGLAHAAHAAALRAWLRRPAARNAPAGMLAAWLYPDGVAAVNVARALGTRVGILVQGSDTFHLRTRGRARRIVAACNRADAVVGVCAALTERLADAGVTRARLSVAPNGVDTERFQYRPAAPARARLGVAAGPLVLFVGNLVPVKGPDLLLRAWRAALPALRRMPGADPRLVLAGSGPLRARLEAESRDLGDAVRFLGARPQAEIADWMNAADALCLSSRSEGMPNVVIEALVSGLPVVASAVGAAPELLSGEGAARVVAPEDSAALAGALLDLLAQTPDRAALAARQAGRFSWTRQAQTIIEAIKMNSGGQV